LHNKIVSLRLQLYAMDLPAVVQYKNVIAVLHSFSFQTWIDPIIMNFEILLSHWSTLKTNMVVASFFFFTALLLGLNAKIPYFDATGS